MPPPSACAWLAAHAAALHFKSLNSHELVEEWRRERQNAGVRTDSIASFLASQEEISLARCRLDKDWVAAHCGLPHDGGPYELLPLPELPPLPELGTGLQGHWPLEELQRHWPLEQWCCRLEVACDHGYDNGILELLRNGDWMADGAEGASEQRSHCGGLSPAAVRRLVLALPTFSSLRLLHLKHRFQADFEHVNPMDTLPFAGLPALEALVLDGFADVNLRGLPRSLCTLRVSAESVNPYWEDDLPGSSLAIPQGCRCARNSGAEVLASARKGMCSGVAQRCAAAPHHGCHSVCCRLASAAVQGYAKEADVYEVGWTARLPQRVGLANFATHTARKHWND